MIEAGQVGPTYDLVAEAWRKARAGGTFAERRQVERLVAPLAPGASILDVGCGSGEPIGRFLADGGFAVTGIDLSPRLIEFARRALPGGTFIEGDMRTVRLDRTFDAVVAWDSVFHLPRADHAPVYARFHAWLRPQGRLLVSLGGSGGDDFTSEMLGARFYYSGHEPEHARELLARAGFRIEHWEVDDPTALGHIAVVAVRLSDPAGRA